MGEVGVLVCQAAVTLTLTGGLLNKRHLFLTIQEAGKSKIKALADLVSGEGHLPSEPSRGGRGEAAPWGLSYNLIPKGSALTN